RPARVEEPAHEEQAAERARHDPDLAPVLELPGRCYRLEGQRVLDEDEATPLVDDPDGIEQVVGDAIGDRSEMLAPDRVDGAGTARHAAGCRLRALDQSVEVPVSALTDLDGVAPAIGQVDLVAGDATDRGIGE